MSLDKVDPTSSLLALGKVSSEVKIKRGKEAMPMSIENIDYERGISENTKRTIRDYLATFYPGTQLKAVRFLSKKKGKDVAVVYLLNEIGEMTALFIGGSLVGAPYLIFMSPMVHTENVVMGSYLAAKKMTSDFFNNLTRHIKKSWNKFEKSGVWLTKDITKRNLLKSVLR